ncbi:MAG: hypothetical protein QOF67_1119 [Mycobacterium sp.]|jgi:hypothetical protein|nr:hypothetical protein [Mycobacterium sp.]MDT5208704.1 hypothetical protein [Mycobacterium sp.]
MTADERNAPLRDPAARGEAARLRADELQLRRAELGSGLAASAESAERARVYAEESLQRAIGAHRSAAEGHLHAGAAHLRAAAAHEQAAMLAGDGSGEAHQDAAELHRAAAGDHNAAAVDEEDKARFAEN